MFRKLRLVEIMVLSVLTLPFVGSTSAAYPSSGYLLGREISWTETLVVVAGRSEAVGGRLYSENIWVSGNYTVKSCCGFSTNDIFFQIVGRDFGGRSYSVVHDGLSFDWNTESNEKFYLSFDNGWNRVCDQGVCSPDPASPSYHNKTIDLSVREVAPPELLNLTHSWYSSLALVVGAWTVGAVLTGIAILIKRRRS